jgi:hypothetical protein
VQPAHETIDLKSASTEALIEASWRAGDLSWTLHEDQYRVYSDYREWTKRSTTTGPGEYQRVFVFDIARRWGKTWLNLTILLEECIRRPGSVTTFACATAKDIGDIVRPLLAEILDRGCPWDLRAEYRVSRQGESGGYYFPEDGPAKGSRIKLVGLDVDPDGLRGRGLDFIVISEAGFIRNLKSTVLSILYPQLQGRPHARILLESSAPVDSAHDFDETFVPDAKLRKAYAFRTIEDNPILPEAEREEFIRASGGRESARCKREYFGIRVRDQESLVVPEFDHDKHVRTVEVPDYADAYVSMDPGFQDLCVVLFAYWDFEHARLDRRRLLLPA